MRWHQKGLKEAVEDLGTSLQGLSSEEVRKRLDEYGPNELKEGKKKTPLMMLLDQFKDFMIIVLIASAVIAGALGEVADTIAIMVIVVLNAIIGFVQEYRAEKAMEALKMMAAPTATVLRDGHTSNIASSDVVPGDVVLLEAGRVVPADLRLIESAQLKVEEAALTGESAPVEKSTAPLHDEMIPLGDRRNMAYKGTIVSYGRGKGVVAATGMETELGRIASMLQSEEEVKTPLQKRLVIVGKRLALAALAICAIVFIVGIMRGESTVLMFLTAVSLAVAAIPEALPAVVTISLALGARKMVKQNALIRKLPAVETLGSVTYICTDKTGTLTLNKMTVEEIYVDGRIIKGAITDLRTPPLNPPLTKGGTKGGVESGLSPEKSLMTAMALSNDASPDAGGNILGDPTEVALYLAAEKAGFKKMILKKDNERVSEIPFDSDRKCMTTVHINPSDGFRSFTKGGVEIILDKSVNILTSGGVKGIERDEIIKVSERMAADGLRVLAVGTRRWDAVPGKMIPEEVENGLTLLGLVGIMDPPREEAKDAVALCKSAGIRPVMITGDHPITARAIARRLGIIDDRGEVITGTHLERLSMEEFEKKVEDIRVYARVAPEQKLKIVKALQDKGQYVAMTGDGVNDAPALKRADIGIAMGITGTDVSKEAAHMILLNDNFATIVGAVREGRRIYDNIRKFFKYMLTSNSGEVWTLFLAPFLGLPIPLLPIHILWINLVTDGAPALALTVEPAEGDVMKRKPRPPQEGLFAGGMWQHILWVGLLMAGMTLFIQAWAITTGHSHWQTMVFTVLCLSQMGHVLAIRSETESLFSQGLLTNKLLIGAFILTFALQMATIYVPFLQPIFKTEALTMSELALSLALSSVVFFAVEVEKYFKRRGI
ncbi:MAG: ATPase [Deltaproteobacteria bacterium RIFCSPLOWO2_12_FULL_43_16]|nr:MAG: ATPase [Deltaproteobacteria bacterium GWA2_43_19]OGQ58522.1 MAG: ATPase [Deltaproteobacteria bacterium RIFCSPLOWO2_12_FULL_43_16]